MAHFKKGRKHVSPLFPSRAELGQNHLHFVALDLNSVTITAHLKSGGDVVVGTDVLCVVLCTDVFISCPCHCLFVCVCACLWGSWWWCVCMC